MTYLFITFAAWAVAGSALTIGFKITRLNRQLLATLREAVDQNNMVVARSSAVIRALANRISPTGHVDLTEDELRCEKIALQIMDWEDGVRVLVK